MQIGVREAGVKINTRALVNGLAHDLIEYVMDYTSRHKESYAKQRVKNARFTPENRRIIFCFRYSARGVSVFKRPSEMQWRVRSAQSASPSVHKLFVRPSGLRSF